jgi:hypothetical protein
MSIKLRRHFLFNCHGLQAVGLYLHIFLALAKFSATVNF